MFTLSGLLSTSMRSLALAASLFLAATPLAAENLAILAKSVTPPTSVTSSTAAVFGFAGRPVGTAARLPQWGSMFERMLSDHLAFAKCVEVASRCDTDQARSWRQMFMAASGHPKAEQLRIVNAFFNRLPYRTDAEIYGRPEYWASPSEFLARSGDCEDYSIAKYLALRQLGFGSDQLRVVAVMDTIRGIGHAVLTVHINGRSLVLDNLSDGIFAESDYAHYIPRHSVSEDGFSLHATKRDIARAQAKTLDRLAKL